MCGSLHLDGPWHGSCPKQLLPRPSRGSMLTSGQLNERAFSLARVRQRALLSAAAALGQTQPVTLEWDQSLEPSLAGYVVYVGNASGLYDEQHRRGLRTSFVYTNAVPGRPYYFSVAGYTPGLNVGPRSEEVLFLTGAGVVPSSPITDEQRAPRRDDESCHCFGRGGRWRSRGVCRGRHCYRVDTLASCRRDRDDLTRPGRASLFVEDERHVRAIEGDLLVPEPLLSAGRSETFAGLVIDPGFADTRFAYVGVVETAPDGDRQLRIVRYREVANVFGEGAALVVGLSLPSEGRPSLAVDAARRLYVAMPGTPERCTPDSIRRDAAAVRGRRHGCSRRWRRRTGFLTDMRIRPR